MGNCHLAACMTGSTSLTSWKHEENEYPGHNNKYRVQNKEKWKEYYKCLQSQFNNLNVHNSVTPEALIGFETSVVTMECKICLSPLENKNKESITWEWAAKNSETLSPVEYSEHVLLAPEDRSLQIFNLRDEHTGQYICKLGESITTPYFLTVINITETTMDKVHSLAAPKGPYSKKPEDISFDLIIDTQWGEWSVCSICGKVGKKHKLGYCTVYFKGAGKDMELQAEEKRKRFESEITKLFKIFKYGIPCQSHILPNVVKTLPEVQGRKNEIMTGYCKVKCPMSKIFEVKDKSGNVIERVDNSVGIYSMFQKLPPIEASVERRLQYEVKGSNIILQCPGNINSDAPIQWQIGEKNLKAERIWAESKGRIFISITDRIHIKKAKISDSNIYSCWQLESLAGTVRLVVEKRFELNFNHSIMLFGLVLILGVFLYIFTKIIDIKIPKK
ncbi:Ig-like V-type domain-containing protein FAM187A isoform X2 [Euwallacea fornicatus]|uniref:Ig-like V-type domain-containing protein FAM187A isoform X2 n=1 Tax=Euwallacea fornicatus TaxID=995702 RepID=UPI00338E913E